MEGPLLAVNIFFSKYLLFIYIEGLFFFYKQNFISPPSEGEGYTGRAKRDVPMFALHLSWGCLYSANPVVQIKH